MRNLKNYDEFMEFVSEALEPIITICADKEVAEAFRSNKLLAAVGVICKKYKEEVAVVLSALDGISVDEFKANFSPLSIPGKLTTLLNAPELKELFASAQQTEGASSSVNAQEPTRE